MNIYTNQNVLEAARDRVSYIFDEFENVVVNMSGGKDSTVVFNLCMEEAERRGRLPLGVLFIDQEAEWQGTIDYMKSIMYDKRVKPYWLQVPIKLFNATSHDSDNWLHCWWPGESWMREKDPIAIKENTYGTDRFKPLFGAFMTHTFPDGNTCFIGGVRAEESPNRRSGLTGQATYKHITWGKKNGSGYTFYPIYDWSFSDIWHAICENKWAYNRVYDGMYRLGVNPSTYTMRISNLNHETAVSNLYYVQELEPQTWNALTARMNGIETIRNVSRNDNFRAQKKLPFMFSSWNEYRDYLLDNLVRDPSQHEAFKKKFADMDALLIGDNKLFDRGCRVGIASILANDYTFTKINDFLTRSEVDAYRKLRQGKTLHKDLLTSKHTKKSIGAMIERIDDARGN